MLTQPSSCLVCNTPLTAQQVRVGVLCGQAMCTWKFNSVPAHQRCAVCGRALTVSQVASQTCANFSCRRTWQVERSIAFKRERRERLDAEALGVRDREAVARHIDDAASYVLAIVPHNHAQSSKLPARRKRKLREHLTRMLEQAIDHQAAVANGTEQPRPPLPPLVPPPPHVADVMMHACIGCRGYCCRTGAEHAYITPYTMTAYLAAHPNDSHDAIVNAYLEHVPDRTLTDGCVYQHAKGCTLPRGMRGDTCNRFYCSSLTEFQEELDTTAPPKAFFVPMHDLRFEHAVFAAPGFVQIVRHRSTTMDE